MNVVCDAVRPKLVLSVAGVVSGRVLGSDASDDQIVSSIANTEKTRVSDLVCDGILSVKPRLLSTVQKPLFGRHWVPNHSATQL